MSKSKFFLWILLTLWILGSTYWHVFKLKNSETAGRKNQLTEMDTISPVKPTKIAEPEKRTPKGQNDFSFGKSDDNVNFEPIKNVLDSLNTFMLANPGKILTITGLYSPEETNKTEFPNLGLARAFRIKKYFLNNGLPDSLLKFRARVRTDLVMEADSVRTAIELGIGSRIRTTPNIAQ